MPTCCLWCTSIDLCCDGTYDASSIFLCDVSTHGFIVADGAELGPEHDSREDGEENRLEQHEHEADACAHLVIVRDTHCKTPTTCHQGNHQNQTTMMHCTNFTTHFSVSPSLSVIFFGAFVWLVRTTTTITIRFWHQRAEKPARCSQALARKNAKLGPSRWITFESEKQQLRPSTKLQTTSTKILLEHNSSTNFLSEFITEFLLHRMEPEEQLGPYRLKTRGKESYSCLSKERTKRAARQNPQSN